MGIVEKAPKKIVWRAIEYYKQNKVLEVHENGKDCYSAIVASSGKTKYDVFIDVKHPKKWSTNWLNVGQSWKYIVVKIYRTLKGWLYDNEF